MLNSNIYDTAEDLFGDSSDEMKAFCDAASDYLRARLKSGITAESCGDAFSAAAAMLALSMKSDAENAAGLGGGYTAGSVTVRNGGASKSAARIRAQAEAIMAPYCRCEDFAFVGVSGR